MHRKASMRCSRLPAASRSGMRSSTCATADARPTRTAWGRCRRCAREYGCAPTTLKRPPVRGSASDTQWRKRTFESPSRRPMRSPRPPAHTSYSSKAGWSAALPFACAAAKRTLLPASLVERVQMGDLAAFASRAAPQTPLLCARSAVRRTRLRRSELHVAAHKCDSTTSLSCGRTATLCAGRGPALRARSDTHERLDLDGGRDHCGATAVTCPERIARTRASWSRSVCCAYASANAATASSNVRRRPR